MGVNSSNGAYWLGPCIEERTAMLKESFKNAIGSFKELEFALFCVEGVAERLGISGDEAYKLLVDASDVLYGYVTWRSW